MRRGAPGGVDDAVGEGTEEGLVGEPEGAVGRRHGEELLAGHGRRMLVLDPTGRGGGRRGIQPGAVIPVDSGQILIAIILKKS